MFNPILNPRIKSIRESATLAINQRAKSMRADGKKIAHFGFGESPFPVHAKLRDELRANAHRKSYLPGLGLPALRQSIVRFYRENAGYNFDESRIAIGPGSKELIFHLLYLLEGPLILPAPSWVSYAPQAAILGKPIIYARANRENNYQINADELASAFAKTDSPQKILILNSPNNPTGQVFSADELARIAKVCRDHNAVIISDEIYAQVDFAKMLSPGIAPHCPERTIVTGGLSKAHSAGGWRLGFAAAADHSLQNVFNSLAIVISETFSCASAPIQYAARIAFEDKEVIQYARECAQMHRAVLNFAREKLIDAGLFCASAEGGFYLFPDFNGFSESLHARGILTSSDLAERLLGEAAVAVLPAQDFGMEKECLACRLSPVDYDGEKVYRAFKENDDDAECIAANAALLIPGIADGCAQIRHWLGN